MFNYNSTQQHETLTDNGKKIKITHVKIKNEKGEKKVTIIDKKGKHSHTMKLTKEEIDNIKQHKFIPTLFHESLSNVHNMRSKSNQTRRINKKERKRS